MTSEFADKVVLVTGSSSGIGAAVAVQFASQGARVVLTGRNEAKLSKVAAKCQSGSPGKKGPLVISGEITDDSVAKRLLQKTIETHGQLDVLVNNAGSARMISGVTDEKAVENLDWTLALNTRAPFYLTHLAVPHLEKTKGNVVNISSIGALKPFPGITAYCMAKAALDMMTKCLALELGPKGIRVNSVLPSGIRTDIAEVMMPGMPRDQVDKMFDAVGATYPLGRIGEPDDIANMTLFLASSRASFITGANVVADGGALYVNTPMPDEGGKAAKK